MASSLPLRRSLVLALALLVLAPTLAAAQTGDGPDAVAGADQEARALFEAAQVAFEQGRFESALEYFRRSYELSRRPGLLFNIGVSAERLRLDSDALAAFRQFLAEVPDTPQRGGIEARIAILERALADRARTSAESTSASPRPLDTVTELEPEPESSAENETDPEREDEASAPSDPAGPIGLLASGGVLAIAGAVLIGVAAGDVASVENATRGTTWVAVADAYSRSEGLSIGGGVAVGVGIALATGGLVWLAIPTSSSGERASLQVAPSANGIAIRGIF